MTNQTKDNKLGTGRGGKIGIKLLCLNCSGFVAKEFKLEKEVEETISFKSRRGYVENNCKLKACVQARGVRWQKIKLNLHSGGDSRNNLRGWGDRKRNVCIHGACVLRLGVGVAENKTGSALGRGGRNKLKLRACTRHVFRGGWWKIKLRACIRRGAETNRMKACIQARDRAAENNTGLHWEGGAENKLEACVQARGWGSGKSNWACIQA